jgi:DNA-3-methyladenine glycosylase II
MDDGLRPVRYDVALALQQLSTADAKLGALIERVGPFALQVKSTHSPFEALLEAILYQQLHANAARAILGRLLALFGDLHPQPEQLLAVPDEMLRAAGLSRGKLLSLRDLAAKSLDGTVPTIGAIRRLPDQEIIERLSHVRGIGTWTAEMLLIFRLGRPDVFPGTDYGIRKGYLLTFGRVKAGKPITLEMLPKAEQMERRAARWKPWRSVASWYLWRACELPPRFRGMRWSELSIRSLEARGRGSWYPTSREKRARCGAPRTCSRGQSGFAVLPRLFSPDLPARTPTLYRRFR